MIRTALAFALAFSTSLAMAAPTFANSLKVTGQDGSELAVFDQTSLEKLGLRAIDTETPWTDGVVHFEGVSLKKVLIEAGVGDASVTALALDDYAVTLSAEDIEKDDPIVATRMNGKMMSIDDKGPFWIIFDFDDIAEERSDYLRGLAVWHLNELEVE